MHLVNLLLFLATPFMVIPSQREALNVKYQKARGNYAVAQKSGKKEVILESFARLGEVGAAVIAANQVAITATTRGNYTYPGDIKTDKARLSYDEKMARFNQTLRDSNATLAGFSAPTEADAPAIKVVDLYSNTIIKAIDTHHITCLNIR